MLDLSKWVRGNGQMFPEVEGYTAAVPSKRDLLTLVKAIQDEVTTAVLEG